VDGRFAQLGGSRIRSFHHAGDAQALAAEGSDMMECANESMLTTHIEPAFPEFSSTTITTNVEQFSPVYRFCAEFGLSPFLRRSIELACEIFTVVGDIHLQFETDPDAGDAYVAIDVPASGTADEIFQGQRRHTRLTRGFPDYARSRLRLAIDPV
jgi:hypothetical protein